MKTKLFLKSIEQFTDNGAGYKLTYSNKFPSQDGEVTIVKTHLIGNEDNAEQAPIPVMIEEEILTK
jgi:hypothetical protein